MGSKYSISHTKKQNPWSNQREDGESKCSTREVIDKCIHYGESWKESKVQKQNHLHLSNQKLPD
jgi:hypothetical protein